jgi:hypothetical protein
MMSFTREAIALAEQFAKSCSEIQILHTSGLYDDSLIRKAGGYNQIIKLYTGDDDKLTVVVEQEIFDYFNRNTQLKPKLKNTHQPWRNGLGNDLITIYIIGK